jgi:cell wall-associated NlpC family hydrolase
MKTPDLRKLASETVNFVKNTVAMVMNIKVVLICGVVVLALLGIIQFMTIIASSYQNLVVAANAAANDPRSQVRFADTSGDTLALQDVALSYLGLPYVFNGATASGADCSGLMMIVYEQAGTKITLPHFANDQAKYGEIIFCESYLDETLDKVAVVSSSAGWDNPLAPADPGESTVWITGEDGATTTLLPGDLLFFNYGRATTSGYRIGHVGMYIGNGQFIHTSNPRENCCIKALYTVDASGSIVWSSYARSCIKITRMLPTTSYTKYVSDLTGSPISDITATDAYNLAVYAQIGLEGKTDLQKYDALVEVINTARITGSKLSASLSSVYSVPAAAVSITPETRRVVRMALIGYYWTIVSPGITVTPPPGM